MIKTATLRNFGPLPNDGYQFAPGLNVIVGENGSGKSQLLKLLYAVVKVHADDHDLTKAVLERAYAEKLVGVFRPDALGRLVKRRQGPDRCEVGVVFSDMHQSGAFSFSTSSKSAVQVDLVPLQRAAAPPVFIPTRELLTLCPWFGPLYDNYHLRFEESWRDTVSLLGAPSVKGAREATVAQMLGPLEEAMGGKVVADPVTGEFYLSAPGEGKMEMPLVAEGLRKLAMLSRLIATGSLLGKGYLFWDEPETNLNPKLIKVVARMILTLCQQGIQVFVATHSLFLSRELEMLLQEEPFRKVQSRYLALKAGTASTPTTLEQSGDWYGIQTLVMLDEELHQSDRFMASEGLHARH
jgi:energy-coupling factor transporter ATP-binding protein EcfA2